MHCVKRSALLREWRECRTLATIRDATSAWVFANVAAHGSSGDGSDARADEDHHLSVHLLRMEGRGHRIRGCDIHVRRRLLWSVNLSQYTASTARLVGLRSCLGNHVAFLVSAILVAWLPEASSVRHCSDHVRRRRGARLRDAVLVGGTCAVAAICRGRRLWGWMGSNEWRGNHRHGVAVARSAAVFGIGPCALDIRPRLSLLASSCAWCWHR
jgi:hypothetical protein